MLGGQCCNHVLDPTELQVSAGVLWGHALALVLWNSARTWGGEAHHWPSWEGHIGFKGAPSPCQGARAWKPRWLPAWLQGAALPCHAPIATQRGCAANCSSCSSVSGVQLLALWGWTPAVKYSGTGLGCSAMSRAASEPCRLQPVRMMAETPAAWARDRTASRSCG